QVQVVLGHDDGQRQHQHAGAGERDHGRHFGPNGYVAQEVHHGYDPAHGTLRLARFSSIELSLSPDSSAAFTLISKPIRSSLPRTIRMMPQLSPKPSMSITVSAWISLLVERIFGRCDFSEGATETR